MGFSSIFAIKISIKENHQITIFVISNQRWDQLVLDSKIYICAKKAGKIKMQFQYENGRNVIIKFLSFRNPKTGKALGYWDDSLKFMGEFGRLKRAHNVLSMFVNISVLLLWVSLFVVTHVQVLYIVNISMSMLWVSLFVCLEKCKYFCARKFFNVNVAGDCFSGFIMFVVFLFVVFLSVVFFFTCNISNLAGDCFSGVIKKNLFSVHPTQVIISKNIDIFKTNSYPNFK